ncbi:MAG: CheR family methyltransferase [Opitutaceae bacterium]
MAIAASDFTFIRDLVFRASAIVVGPGKEYLVETRLAPLAKVEGFASIDELIRRMRTNPSPALEQKVVDMMTTNESSFFRDLHPFDALRKVMIPALIERAGPRRALNIWCAACSSGQEPFSIAMMLKDEFPALANWQINITATDISTTMLTRAKSGLFNQIEVNRGLPAHMLVKHFTKTDGLWRIRDDIQKMVTFREMNLILPWTGLPKCDLVFCRNVLIYFDAATKADILKRIRTVLKPEGCLFLGGAESTLGLDDAYKRQTIDRAVFYQAPASSASLPASGVAARSAISGRPVAVSA